MARQEGQTAPVTEPEWAAFVAIDWADKKHDWELVEAGGRKRESGQMENTPEAVSDWAMELYRRFGGRPVAVCLEQSRGALIFQLMKYPHLTLYPVDPRMMANFRKTFFPSGSKSDAGDTSLLLDILVHHRGRLRRLDPDTVETRTMQMLVEERRRIVDDKTRLSNRLTSMLKMYFPQMLQWMDDIDSPLSCAMLLRWPALEQIQRAHPGTLKKFFHEHNCRGEELIEKRIAAIGQAQPAVNDAALLTVTPMVVTALVQEIEGLRERIKVFDEAIERATTEHEETPLFENLPGAGKVLLPRLLAAFGTKRERWENAGALQSFSGIAPVTVASGKSRWVHFRAACPKFLRQTFHEFAACSIPRSKWAGAYYDHQLRANKGHHHAAVRSLAFKWIRILYHCWKTRTPYDENIYLAALEKRRSPLATLVKWNTVAGFQKISSQNS